MHKDIHIDLDTIMKHGLMRVIDSRNNGLSSMLLRSCTNKPSTMVLTRLMLRLNPWLRWEYTHENIRPTR